MVISAFISIFMFIYYRKRYYCFKIILHFGWNICMIIILISFVVSYFLFSLGASFKHLIYVLYDEIFKVLMFANVGNLVLPVIAMMLGSEMTFYCAGFQMPFNLFTWIYGYMLMSGRRDVPVRKIVFNPNLIALFLGFIFLLTGLKMPAVIDTAMEGLQNMVAGASMMLVGVVIAGSDLKEIFANKRAYLISAGRLIVIPILTILILFATGFLSRHPQYSQVLMVIMIAAAAPSASSVVQLSVLTGGDAPRAGAYNVMTTLLCVLTMPLIIYIYQMFFPM